jgi:hypothetical protein
MSRPLILPFIIIDDEQAGARSKAGEIWQLDMSLIQIAFSHENIL